MSPAWDSSSLRRLLTPARGTVRTPEPREPRDFVRAIDEVMLRLDGAARDSASRASASAHQLVDILEQCDNELRAVSMAGDAGASDRIAEQIAALESSARAGREMTELLRLLRAQLEVVERVRVRCEVLSSRRAHLLQLLQGLWTRIAALQEQAPESLDQLERIRSEIEAELKSLSS